MKELGQIIVAVGVFIVILGVAVAAVQTVIEAIKKKEAAITANTTVPDWPDKLWEIILELVKKGGGLAIAAVGLVVIFIGLQMMNSATVDEAKEASALRAPMSVGL